MDVLYIELKDLNLIIPRAAAHFLIFDYIKRLSGDRERERDIEPNCSQETSPSFELGARLYTYGRALLPLSYIYIYI